MATTTDNYGLTKPEYSDTADIMDINGNMDTVDAALGGLGSAIAIIADGDTHAALAKGDYVYVRKHSTLTEGLYTAKNTIEEDGTLTSNNLAAAGDIANSVKDLDLGKVPYTDFASTTRIGVTIGTNSYSLPSDGWYLAWFAASDNNHFIEINGVTIGPNIPVFVFPAKAGTYCILHGTAAYASYLEKIN